MSAVINCETCWRAGRFPYHDAGPCPPDQPMAGPSDADRIEQAAFERGRTAERARILGEDPNKTATKAIVADVLRHEVLTEIVMWLDERAVNTTAQLDDECDGNDAERICAQAETLTAAARALERYRDITGNRGGK